MTSSHAPAPPASDQGASPWTIRDLPRLALKSAVLIIGLAALTAVVDALIPSFPGATHVRYWLRMTVFFVFFNRWLLESKVSWLPLTAFVAVVVALLEGAWFLLELVLAPVTGRSPW